MKFIELSSHFKNTTLNINSNETESIKTLQLQCSGDLSYDHSRGVISNLSDKYIDGFFEKNIGFNADLILTPECCIPFRYIKKIVENRAEDLNEHKLWCLCCEGIPYQEFIDYKSEIMNATDVDIICDLNNLDRKKYVNTLWYFFKTSEGNLAVVIQLKLFPMKDIYHIHEARDLTTGKTIYIFDLYKDSRNEFASLICADAVRVDNNKLFSKFTNKCLLIFNPQLNQNPKADDFRQFRQQLFTSDNIDRCKRYIGLNWAVTTKLNGQDFKVSGSGYYSNYASINLAENIKDIVNSKKALNMRKQAHAYGVYYSYSSNSHYNIWSFSNQEHAICYEINKTDVFGVNENLKTKIDPLIEDKYFFIPERQEWQNINADCINNKNFLGTDETLKANLPYSCNENCDGSSCRLVENEYFIALCFGSEISKEFLSKEEVFNRTVIHLCDKSKLNQRRKINRLKKLFSLIESNNLPDTLKPMFKNFKYDFNEELFDKPAYNISFSQEEYPYKKGIVAIMLEDCTSSEVEKTYDMLKTITIKDYYQQIVLYYSECGDGFEYFHKPYEGNKFTPENPDYVKEIASISRG